MSQVLQLSDERGWDTRRNDVDESEYSNAAAINHLATEIVKVNAARRTGVDQCRAAAMQAKLGINPRALDSYQ
jgi:hypothetical protein